MDKLKQAMQSEDFWIELADTSFGKIILHGKNTNSSGACPMRQVPVRSVPLYP